MASTMRKMLSNLEFTASSALETGVSVEAASVTVGSPEDKSSERSAASFCSPSVFSAVKFPDQAVNACLIELTQKDEIFQIREGSVIFPCRDCLTDG